MAKITREELKKLVNEGADHAHRILVTNQAKELMPVFYLVSPDPEKQPHVVAGTPWNGDSEKRQAVAAVKHMSREINAEAVVFSCEVWIVKLDLDQRMRGDRPSESPDRIEGVMIVGVNRQMEWETCFLQTKRIKPGGKIVSLERDPETPGTYESWMFDGMFNKEESA